MSTMRQFDSLLLPRTAALPDCSPRFTNVRRFHDPQLGLLGSAPELQHTTHPKFKARSLSRLGTQGLRTQSSGPKSKIRGDRPENFVRRQAPGSPAGSTTRGERLQKSLVRRPPSGTLTRHLDPSTRPQEKPSGAQQQQQIPNGGSGCGARRRGRNEPETGIRESNVLHI
ncbi:hypothetical protein NDU88_002062 [Pleurodeles waltl]|uniref:Uncharacterized protein n=1 Tax=Pleurodeles waltl TaxID=8319 RepID=A0AAV7P8W8_PLEWA|nr:hypothetical protein NDU88_002062 [Pleurodeles waltl]